MSRIRPHKSYCQYSQYAPMCRWSLDERKKDLKMAATCAQGPHKASCKTSLSTTSTPPPSAECPCRRTSSTPSGIFLNYYQRSQHAFTPKMHILCRGSQAHQFRLPTYALSHDDISTLLSFFLNDFKSLILPLPALPFPVINRFLLKVAPSPSIPFSSYKWSPNGLTNLRPELEGLLHDNCCNNWDSLHSLITILQCSACYTTPRRQPWWAAILISNSFTSSLITFIVNPSHQINVISLLA